MLNNKSTLSILFSCFLLPLPAFAVGGNGATCNPSTANWGSCSLAAVPFQSSVTNSATIPGGTYTSPFVASQSNTKYTLQGNITASGTAISVTGSYVIIDLNGYTITYNQSSPGQGVVIGGWNVHHVSVRNGSIIQGAAKSEGDEYGNGNNPVGEYSNSMHYTSDNMHVANLYVRYSGKDVGGIHGAGNNGLYEQNTIEDTYQFGTLKNRHSGIDALTGVQNLTGATGNVYRYNTIKNARQRGIYPGDSSTTYGNNISLRTISTNGYGVFGWAGKNYKIYSNTITARGEHPLGIGFVGEGSNTAEIYDNYIDAKTTALGDEYGSAYSSNPSGTITGNYAVGFRTTWGGNNINFHDNEIVISTDSKYVGTYSPTGATAYIDAGGRGLMVATPAGETATFANNKITVLDKDGTGRAYGIACTGNNESDKLYFLNNTVTSNIANIVIADEYGYCNGYPLFAGNVLIKSGSTASYKTYINGLGGYYTGKARVVNSTYQNGASADSVNLNPAGDGVVDVYFGTYSGSQYLYNYRLHDNSGSSSTLLKETFGSAKTLSYTNPATMPPAASTPPTTPPVTIPAPQGLIVK